MDGRHLTSFRSAGTTANLPSTSNPNRNSQHYNKTPPNSNYNSRTHRDNRNRNNHNNNSNNRKKKNYQKAKERQTREKFNSSFFLYASPTHAFVISRIPVLNEKNESHKSNNNGSTHLDVPIAWDRVRIVKSLASTTNESSTIDNTTDIPNADSRCSICLDTFTSPRITKCGHIYCYACILQHFYSSTNQTAVAASSSNNNNGSNYSQQHLSTKTGLTAKCPCCFHPIQREELKPVQILSVQSPAYERGITKHMTFRKIFRTRDATAAAGVPYLPRILKETTSDGTQTLNYIIKRQGSTDDNDYNQNGSSALSQSQLLPTVTDDDAPFSRYNYLDVSSYIQHLDNDLISLQHSLEELTSLYGASSNNKVDNGGDDGTYFTTMALQAVEVERAVAMADGEEENIWRVRMEERQERQYIKDNNVKNNQSQTRVGNEMMMVKADTSTTLDEPKRSPRRRKNSRGNDESLLRPGEMYLDSDSVQFYQSSDGQLCFLSSFNITCLSHDYSFKQTVNPNSNHDNNNNSYDDSTTTIKPPFPDEIHGTILDLEHIHLTPEIRNRTPYLSHLPLYTDITFIELDLNRFLSPETRQRMKPETDRRRKKRHARRAAEKKESTLAQQRQEKRVLRNLERDSMMMPATLRLLPTSLSSQPLPPMSSPFLTGDDFGPGLPSVPTTATANSSTSTTTNSSSSLPSNATATNNSIANNSDPTLSFKSVCASSGAFPKLSTTSEESFPALGAESSKTTTTASASAPTVMSWRKTCGRTPRKNGKNIGKR